MKKKMIILCCTSLCMALGVGAANRYLTGGYAIVAEGKTLGIVTDEAQFTNALLAVNQELLTDFGDDARLRPAVEVKSCLVTKEQVTSQQELYENIAAMSVYMAKAHTLVVDGKKTISFRTAEDLNKALEIIKDAYRLPDGTATIWENISTETEYISVADLYSAEDGADYLTECDIIHVYTTKETESRRIVDYAVMEQPDDTLYQGERKTVRAGAAGEYLVRTKTEYIDGVETQTGVLSETWIRKPVDALVSVGTKALPEGTGEFILPVCGVLTSGYGERWGRTHTGLDLAAATGTEILAADTGVVSFAGEQGSYGNLIKVDHRNGYETYYAHCSEFVVKVGDVVQKGQTIALVGSTGNSTGPHCHFEIRLDGRARNPAEFVE